MVIKANGNKLNNRNKFQWIIPVLHQPRVLLHLPHTERSYICKITVCIFSPERAAAGSSERSGKTFNCFTSKCFGIWMQNLDTKCLKTACSSVLENIVFHCIHSSVCLESWEEYSYSKQHLRIRKLQRIFNVPLLPSSMNVMWKISFYTCTSHLFLHSTTTNIDITSTSAVGIAVVSTYHYGCAVVSTSI